MTDQQKPRFTNFRRPTLRGQLVRDSLEVRGQRFAGPTRWVPASYDPAQVNPWRQVGDCIVFGSQWLTDKKAWCVLDNTRPGIRFLKLPDGDVIEFRNREGVVPGEERPL